jgi:tRNA 2-thiouridine synthesizing protein A
LRSLFCTCDGTAQFVAHFQNLVDNSSLATEANANLIKLERSPIFLAPFQHVPFNQYSRGRPNNKMNAENAETYWDAGEMGCGELVIKLLVKFRTLAAGTIFHLRASDTGAVQDIPAWCSMTGNQLVRAAHPDYWIERRA